MAHPHKGASEANKETRLSRLGMKPKHTIAEAVKRSGGGDELKKAKVPKGYADGGMIPGEVSKPRADRSKRGQSPVTVNVVVAGDKPQPPMMPAGGPPPMGAVPPGPPPVRPGAPAGAPPGIPGMPGIPGGGPQGLSAGMLGRKRGGGVYDAGAGTGLGREEKISKYGKKAKK